MGIEEEYLLVDRETGELISTQPHGLMERVTELRYGLVSHELFDSQIEIGTGICHDVKQLRADVGLLRLAVSEAAEEYGLAPIAASTHPGQDGRSNESPRGNATRPSPKTSKR